MANEQTEKTQAAGTGQRMMLATFGIFGGAVTSRHQGGLSEAVVKPLVPSAPAGADIKWVASVLGAAPPGVRTGVLATTDSEALCATLAIAEGCRVAGDGGGGVFMWSASSGTDDGGTFIVPNGGIGSSGGGWQRIYTGGPIDVTWFGATGDGETDDAPAFRLAVNAAAGGVLEIPRAAVGYRITTTIPINAPMKLTGPGRVIFDFGASPDSASPYLFKVTASDVDIDGLWIDGTGLNPTSTLSRSAIFIEGTPGAHVRNVRVRNCRFVQLSWGNASPPGVIGTHAVYATLADDTNVRDCVFDTIHGAAVFLSFSERPQVSYNTISNTAWYSIQLQQAVNGADISNNRIVGDNPGIRYWGGSIYLMSDGANVQRAHVRGNYIRGVHSYGVAIDLASCSQVDVEGNLIESVPNQITYIRIETRNTPGTNLGASQSINVRGNVLVAGGVNQIGIYADNASGGASDGVGRAHGLIVQGNQVGSPDASRYFGAGVSVHAQQGGWSHVSITGNHVQGISGGAPVDGLIGINAYPAVGNTDVQIVGNLVRFLGKGVQSSHIGIYLGANTQRVLVEGNLISDCFYAVRSADTVSDFVYGEDNLISGSTMANTLFVSPPSKAHLSAAVDWTPGTVSPGALVSRTLSVPGAAVGDRVSVGFTTQLPGGLVLSGQVTAADTLIVTLINLSGTAATVGSGTLRVGAER